MNLTAYIDPGTTALILQILAGVFVVSGVVLGIWWTKITTFIKSTWAKMFKKKKNNEMISQEEDEALAEILYELTDEESLEDKNELDDKEKLENKEITEDREAQNEISSEKIA